MIDSTIKLMVLYEVLSELALHKRQCPECLAVLTEMIASERKHGKDSKLLLVP